MAGSPPAEGFWIHFVETVYGAWLYGDARGFRTRHHREHVEGDYKNPPPINAYKSARQGSVKNLKQVPVVLQAAWRPIIGEAVRSRLVDQGAFVLCLAQGGQHLHLLAKLPLGADPRLWMGLAKKHSAFEAKNKGWQGKLWGKRGKEVRVRDRAHQRNVYHYILEHAQQGAWVWVWKPEAHGQPSVDSGPEAGA
jgi:hypothetical protein